MLEQFLETVKEKKPQFLKSILNSQEQEPELFVLLGEKILALLNPSQDRKRIEDLVHSYCSYTYEQNRLQFIYELSGAYPAASHDEANTNVYQNYEVMLHYMESLLLTQFLWPHHLQIVRFFVDRYLPYFREMNNFLALELAPGHGLFGRIMLEKYPAARIKAYDISPISIEIATTLAKAKSLNERTEYVVRDALDQSCRVLNGFEAIIAGELMEHLDDPSLLCESIHDQLKPNGFGFLTAAITAANLDHVYEFKSPEEVREMVKKAGLAIIDEIVTSPPSIKASQTKIPRVQAMVIKKA